MADRIKGITIVIDGDATPLSKALKEVNDGLRQSQNELKDVNRLLKLDPGNTELLQQKYKDLSNAIEGTEKKLKQLKDAESQMKSAGQTDTADWDKLQREIVDTEQKLKGLKQEMNEFGSVSAQKVAAVGEKFKEVGTNITNVGSTLTKNVTVPVAAAFTGAAKSAIDFESALTGVKKTNDELVDSNGNVIISYDDIAESIKQMSTETASSKEEIAAVMEAAGQLGVGTEYLVDFAKAMIMIGDSTNLSADEAATAIAKMANVTGMSLADVDKFGASLVALGNNFATDEQAIMEMATRLSGAGAQIGLSNGEILGLATALSSVGIQAEMGGSAFSKAMIKMQVATETGYESVRELEQATGLTRRELELMASNNSKDFKALADSLGMTKEEMNNIVKAGKNLEDFADVAGLTVDEFVQQFRTDAPAAIQAFISGLGDVDGKGESTIQMLQEMGFTEVRLRDTLTRLANSGDLVTNAVEMGNEAWRENSALTEEAEKRYSTTESQIHQLKETITNLGIDIGGILLPAVSDIVNKIKEVVEWLNSLDPATKEMIVRIGLVLAAAGPLLIVIGQLTTAISSIMTFAPTLVTGFKLVSGVITGTAIPAIGGVITAIAPFLPIIAAVAAAIAGIILIVKNWGAISEWFKGVWDKVCSGIKTAWEAVTSFFTETLPNFFSNLASKWSDGWNAIKSKAGEIWESTKQKASEVFGNIRNTVTDSLSAAKEKTSHVLSEMKNTYQENGSGIKGVVSVMAQGINTINTNLLNNLNSITGGKLGELLKSFSDKFGSIRETVGNIMSNIINSAFKWGSDLVNGIANGIMNAINSVRNAASNIANAIASFLHFSVPDEGPLTEYEKWMPDFMGSLAKSIEMNRGVVRKAIEGVSQDMVITQGFTVSGSSGKGAALNAGSMKTMLSDMVSKINSGTQGRDITVILEMNRHEFGRGVFKANNEETQRYGVSLGGLAY